MPQDRFVKTMLVVIAALLALNLFKSSNGIETANAFAQSNPAMPTAAAALLDTKIQATDVKPVKGYAVSNIKDVVAVGDGKTFVVAAPDKFMVYRVDSTPVVTKQ